MGVSFSITHPDNLPDPQEPIVSFSRCPGNILMATQDVGHGRLDHSEEPEEALRALIEELDRGDSGKFTWDYWLACDAQWSGGKETRALLEEWRPLAGHLPISVEAFLANSKRTTMRAAAFRFYSYFEMGYYIEWQP